MLSSITQHYRIQMRFGLIWLVFLSFLAIYWLRLDALHDTQLVEAEQRAQLRASQAAHALIKRCIKQKTRGVTVFVSLLRPQFCLLNRIGCWSGSVDLYLSAGNKKPA
ncbi:MAG: hypothetical protein GX673_03100 [Gammaproteobacteria bacterium]|nr:hypothetical protein [Gammaproteobacteria bacterium]